MQRYRHTKRTRQPGTHTYTVRYKIFRIFNKKVLEKYPTKILSLPISVNIMSFLIYLSYDNSDL